ncbi:macrolide family glycosyltransferase [Sedimentibacter sp. B4]|uniref:macrolide family glycosyltransferase n=1 Tax=Sedimentibacter sp. B4 TaxID=304766 RepID=UPI0003118AB3|nr:macrolide family glycosyltransferase [Sedimentibacter sp. B4]
MSKIVYFCIPAHGHTNPTLPVIRELVSLGHEVYYYSFQEFKEKIEATGAYFIGCDHIDIGMEDDGNGADRVGKDIVFSTELIVKSTLAFDDIVTNEMAKLKPDVIISDSVAYWGKLAAMKLGIPFVSSTTTFAFNQFSSKIMKKSFGDLIKMLFQMPKTKKILQPLRDKGYPADNILSIVQNDNETNTIVYTSPEFQPCSDTFSEKYSFVGPCIREASTIIEKTAEKLIYISLGTVNNKLADFYNNCIKAFADSEYEVIMSVGKSTDVSSLGSIPANIHVYNSVDQIAVLQKADIFLSHCGMNSANESLYHKVPLVMFPQTAEQVGVARRIAELGAGLFLDKSDSSSIKAAVQTVLDDENYRNNAAAISDSFHKCGGAKVAAQAILRGMVRR